MQYQPTTTAAKEQHTAPQLKVGASHDSHEQEADTIADRVMRMPLSGASPVSVFHGGAGTLQRKCDACEKEEEKVQRKPLVQAKSQMAQGGFGVSSQVSSKIAATRGGGNALDPQARGWMEPRFGHDFSGVRVHTGDYAAQLSNQIQAKAFTIGRDIYFNSGEYQPGTESGQRLLAHELTHTLQQGQGQPTMISRKVAVEKPADNIPDPTGKGAKQTNAATFQSYVDSLCPEGKFKVDAKSGVLDGGGFCKPTAGAGPATGAWAAKHLNSCTRLCDLTASTHKWIVRITDTGGPHTNFDNDEDALDPKKGTGGSVEVPSPNRTKDWGAAGKDGRLVVDPEWLILGHELLGHAHMGDKGLHQADQYDQRGRGGHRETIKRENEIAKEHGLPLRGNHRTAFCGESFSMDRGKGLEVVPKNVTFSSEIDKCKAWRVEYNNLNKTKFTIGQTIPKTPGEKLPPNTVEDGVLKP